MQSKLITLLKGLIILSFGFLIGKFISFPKFQIDDKINLVDVAAILVTLLAAWWVSEVIEKKKVGDRGEIEIFLKRIDEIEGLVKEFQQKIDTGKISLSDITSSLKRIQTSFDSIYNLLAINSYSCDPIVRSYINLYLNNLRRLLTYTPHTQQAQGSTDLTVSSGIVNIGEGRISIVDVEIENLRNYIMRFEFEINKH